VRAPFLVSSYRTFQLTLVLVYAIALLGLQHPHRLQRPDLPRAGAFYALGAYCAAILIDQGGPRRMGGGAPRRVCPRRGFCSAAGAAPGGAYLASATFALAWRCRSC